MSLWLCLRFDQLPLQCLNRSENQAVAVIHKQRVVRVNNYAASLGVREGMATATVRALADSDTGGSILLLEQDTQAEQRSLHRLCCWAYSVSPALYTYRADCLLMEIGACIKLFKGLNILLEEVFFGIGARGYQVQHGLAPTPKAAWLLSFSENDETLHLTNQALHQSLQQRLSPLSLKLLDEFPSTIDSLHRAGLRTLGDILALPLDALGRRCGKKFTFFLQQVLGQQPDLNLKYQPPMTYSDEYWFGYEVSVNEELFPAIQLLLQSLCQFLRNTQLQTSDITWKLIGIDGQLRAIGVGSSTSHSDWEVWYQLTRIRLDQLQIKNAVEGISLNCRNLYAGQLESMDLFSPHNQREPLNSLLDRLRNRLGLQAIEKISCRDEHLPEFSVHLSNDDISGKGNSSADNKQSRAQRPFWLMPQPQVLKYHRNHLHWNGALTLVYGPERIEDNWWAEAISRDYFIAENSGGQRYWIFKDRLNKQWLIHGIFT